MALKLLVKVPYYKSYEERMRKAFTRTQTLVQDIKAALGFRRSKENMVEYVKKIKRFFKPKNYHFTFAKIDMKKEVKMKEWMSAQKIRDIYKI